MQNKTRISFDEDQLHTDLLLKNKTCLNVYMYKYLTSSMHIHETRRASVLANGILPLTFMKYN